MPLSPLVVVNELISCTLAVNGTCISSVLSEMRRKNIDPLEDPDFTLIVRVQDLAGASVNALSGNTKVHIVVQPNVWVNPGPVTVREHLDTSYPVVIAKVC